MTVSGRLENHQRYGTALVSLGLAPVRLRRLLDGFGPAQAWAALMAGRHPADPTRTLMARARATRVDCVEAGCARAGVGVHVLGRPDYPASLGSDPEAPGVLFSLGDPGCFDTRPRVAVVGTRSATPYGLGMAAELGRALAGAGVVVVSGLAPGIDSAAHAGALGPGAAAPAVGVVGVALDTAVPKAEAQLRGAVEAGGIVLSERAPGMGAAPPWCLVARARIMAALAHVVVVVESHHRGGSMHTVKAASDRGVPVAAVPGSVRSSASRGTNALLVEGAAPVRDVTDVLALVELAVAGRPEIAPPTEAARRVAPPTNAPNAMSAAARRTLDALDQDPASLDTVVRRCGLTLGEVSEALEELSATGAVGASVGRWWRR